MDKMCCIGLNEHTLRWKWNYLSNRLQKVVVNGSISSSTPVRSGVPQGAVLQPLLYIMYINDLTLLLLAAGSKPSLTLMMLSSTDQFQCYLTITKSNVISVQLSTGQTPIFCH